MLSKLIDGISQQLDSEFGDGYRIYSDEDVEQGFKEPCFFITLVTSSRDGQIDSGYTLRCLFDILYFPDSRGNNADMHRIAMRLYDAMEKVSVGSRLVKGIDKHFNITDDVLHFFVAFNLLIWREEQAERMQEISIETNVNRE